MIAKFLYNNPRLLLLAIAVIVVAGSSAIHLLPRLEDPILSKRVAVISTVYPGANAKQIESTVTIPIEQQLAGIARIKKVRSSSLSNISNIVIELEDEVTDVDTVWSNVRERINEAAKELPGGCEPPKLDVFPLKAFATIVSLTATNQAAAEDVDLHELRRAAAVLKSRLGNLSGTEEVQVFGDAGEEIVIELTPAKLAETGMSIAAIAVQVQNRTAPQTPGGILLDETNLLFDAQRDQDPEERLATTQITYGPKSSELKEIATIERRTIQPLTDRAIVADRDAFVLGVMVDDRVRVDQWMDTAELVLGKFSKEFGDRVNVEVLFSQRDHIDQRMSTLLENLGMGTIAVVLVVLLLMGWRSMIVVATSLPLSALMVFGGMRLLSIPIHQMSVTGLIVALGLLIDNAIVIVEEVRGKLYAGDSPLAAIQKSVRHLAMPLFGSTVTTALAFLPIATLPGPAGEFVGTIAVSVILAVSSSFVLAMTIIPAMTGLLRINSAHRNSAEAEGRTPENRSIVDYGLSVPPVERFYFWTLKHLCSRPIEGLLLGLALPISGYIVARQLPQQFFPPTDRAQIQIEVERPARDTIDAVAKTVNRVREVVSKDSRIERQSWFLGRSAPTFYYNVVPRRRGTPYYAQAFIDVKTGRSMSKLVRELQTAIDAEVQECRTVVRQLEQGPPFDAPIEIRLAGPDESVLKELGDQIRALLSRTDHVVHTRSDLADVMPKMTLNVNQATARQNGLSELEVAQFLYTTTQGASAGSVFIDDEELPVRVKLAYGTNESKLDTLRSLKVPVRNPPSPPQPATGQTPTQIEFPTLGSLAELQLDSDAGSIVRLNGQRINEVKAYISAGVLPSIVLEKFKQRLSVSNIEIPDGYELQIGGESEQRSTAVSSLIANSVIIFSAMLFILVAVFGSFRSAAIIAAVGGLSVGLGPLSLFLFQFPFGFMAIVGTMGLIGIAINDSIVVLAAIRAMDKSDQTNPESVAKTVFHCTRHIIATTLTTIAGFLPLVVGAGEFWPPLAISIAGGVGGATLIALYFVPSLFLLLRKRAAK